MTNGNGQVPRTAGGRPAITSEPAQQEPIQPADQTPPVPAEERPHPYKIKLYAVAPQGYVVEIESSEVTRPVNWISSIAEGLEKLHYAPIDPYAPANVDVDVAAPSAAASAAPGAQSDAGGVATWIPGENGGPPRCSVHGPAKWVEGNNAKGHYAFWACSFNTQAHPCKPAGKPS